MAKEPGKRIPWSFLEETRFRALEAIDRGCHSEDVAVMFGAGVSTVYGWMQTRREFGVEYTPQGVGQLMRRMGLSPQRPLTRAWEQDPGRVRRWREEEYPAIHAEAESLGASVLFEDEAGVRTDYHAGTTWAQVGCTPVVHGTGNRKTVTMMSAVSAQGKLHFSLVLPGAEPRRVGVEKRQARQRRETCRAHGRRAQAGNPEGF